MPAQDPQPLVSILTPAYQQAGYIGRCVESALAQTYPRWELVVVDDGSTDGTAEAAEAYRDPRVRVLRLPHRGLGALAATYNAALAETSGPLVAILEGDDRWPADKLALQVPLFEDEAVALSWGAGELVDAADRPLETVRRGPGEGDVRVLRAPEALRRLALGNLFTPTVTVMVRRRELDAVGGFSSLGSELFVDLPTWLRLAAATRGTFVYLDRVLGVWRQHAAQTTARTSLRMFVEHAAAVRELGRLLGEDALARAGLGPRLLHDCEAQGEFYAGLVALSEGRRAESLAHHRAALRRAATWRWRKRAAMGALSAVTGLDLTGRLRAARRRG